MVPLAPPPAGAQCVPSHEAAHQQAASQLARPITRHLPAQAMLRLPPAPQPPQGSRQARPAAAGTHAAAVRPAAPPPQQPVAVPPPLLPPLCTLPRPVASLGALALSPPSSRSRGHDAVAASPLEGLVGPIHEALQHLEAAAGAHYQQQLEGLALREPLVRIRSLPLSQFLLPGAGADAGGHDVQQQQSHHQQQPMAGQQPVNATVTCAVQVAASCGGGATLPAVPACSGTCIVHRASEPALAAVAAGACPAYRDVSLLFRQRAEGLLKQQQLLLQRPAASLGPPSAPLAGDDAHDLGISDTSDDAVQVAEMDVADAEDDMDAYLTADSLECLASIPYAAASAAAASAAGAPGMGAPATRSRGWRLPVCVKGRGPGQPQVQQQGSLDGAESAEDCSGSMDAASPSPHGAAAQPLAPLLLFGQPLQVGDELRFACWQQLCRAWLLQQQQQEARPAAGTAASASSEGEHGGAGHEQVPPFGAKPGSPPAACGLSGGDQGGGDDGQGSDCAEDDDNCAACQHSVMQVGPLQLYVVSHSYAAVPAAQGGAQRDAGASDGPAADGVHPLEFRLWPKQQQQQADLATPRLAAGAARAWTLAHLTPGALVMDLDVCIDSDCGHTAAGQKVMDSRSALLMATEATGVTAPCVAAAVRQVLELLRTLCTGVYVLELDATAGQLHVSCGW